MDDQAIIVTGMHRSGTSMLMSLLDEAGVSFGPPKNLLHPSFENPRGYYENQNILDFNNHLLRLLGGSWDSVDAFKEINDLKDEQRQQMVDEAAALVAKLSGNNPIWAMKDPRFMLTLPFWHSVVPNMKVVVCLRNPVEVALSLSNRIGDYHVDFPSGLALWEKYYSTFVTTSSGFPVLITHFDSYSYDYQAELKRLYLFLGLDLGYRQLPQKKVTGNLRHYQIDSAVLDELMPGSTLVQLYSELCERSGEGYQAGKGSGLPRSNAELQWINNLTRSQQMAQSIFLERRVFQEKSSSLSAQLRTEKERYSHSIQKNTTLESALVDLEKRNHSLEAMLEDQNQVILVTEDEIKALREKLSGQQQENQELRSELEHAENLQGLLNTQLQGILNSRTWQGIERIRHVVGMVFPFLLKSPYRKGSIHSSMSTIAEVHPELSVYAEVEAGEMKKRVLYIHPNDPSLRASIMYRVFNMVSYLESSSEFSAEASSVQEILENIDACLHYDLLIFFRLPYTEDLAKLIDKAKRRKIVCCYDIDDYVFDLKIFKYVDPLKNFDHDSLLTYFEGVSKYRKLMQLCDYFIGTTQTLADLAGKLGLKSFVIHNGLNTLQEEKANSIIQSSRKKQDHLIRIGYLSGTNTHNKDFLVAESALLRILSEFKQVRLLIRGQLDLSEKFGPFSSQIEMLPFVPFEELIPAMQSLDFVIAPLEINPYTQSKSELKYFEPALIKLPVVASPTEAFRYAIKDGENGFLAETETEWYEKMKTLVLDEESRLKIGSNARIHALSVYGVVSQQKNLETTLSAALTDYFGHTRAIDLSSLQISWVLPAPISGSGGHRVIFDLCNSLSASGHEVKLHFLPDPNFMNGMQIREYIDEKFFPIDGQIFNGIGEIESCDVLIATSWNTAATVYNYRKLARKAMYFVQDYEPYFFPMSSDYIAAYGTYSMGLDIITIGEWLAHKLAREFNVIIKSIQFPIDHAIYSPLQDANEQLESKKVLFFARNTMARRCYPLGVEALKNLKKRRPDLEIVLFGSNAIDESDFPYEHTNMGVLTPNQLADLYRSASVGISFSTTNPSIVPFEMLACGLPVVDLDFNDNPVHYGGYENVTLAKPNPFAIAEAIIQLLSQSNLWLQKRTNGIEFAQMMPDRAEAAREFEHRILDILSQ